MLDELSLMQRYRLSLYQEASSVGEARKKAVIWVGGRATSGSLGLQSSS
jgi:hypothetical protein